MSDDLVTCAGCALKHRPRAGGCPRCATRGASSSAAPGTREAKADDGGLRFGALAIDTLVMTACLFVGGGAAFAVLSVTGRIPVVSRVLGVLVFGFFAFVPFTVYQSMARPDQPRMISVFTERAAFSSLPRELQITIGVSFALAAAGALFALRAWVKHHGG